MVTGASRGIGYCTARALAASGARVVLACRDERRGKAAEARIHEEVPGADAEFAPLDLADLSSVRAFARGHAERYGAGGLDLLVNNAGVMAVPYRRTADGFETQFGVNHLGHFALTGLLLPSLLARPGARVVSVSSAAHFLAAVDLGDLNNERRYRPWVAYGRSKTANLLFVHELAHRARTAGADLVAAAAQPGYAATNLQAASAASSGHRTTGRIRVAGARLLAQSPEAGALPTLYAATAPGVRPDAFYGPRFQMWRGSPVPSWRSGWARDAKAAELLWCASEQLTGVTYGAL